MIVKTAEFVVSSSDVGQCPPPNKPEFAFIGRSNVGKSSLINLLVSRKNLAKTSSTPGKTQLINHFVVNGQWYLVDLPGYGYASVSKTAKGTWGAMIENYLKKRENLMTTFLLIDPRLTPQPIDLSFIEWMGHEGIPFVIVFTKADKLSRSQLSKTLQQWENKLLQTWSELPPVFASSASTRAGREELLDYIESLLSPE